MPFFHGVKEVQEVQDLLALERLKEEYERLERRGIPMSVREWYERRLARLRAKLRGRRHGQPLGEILMGMGVIDRDQLERALSQQRTGSDYPLLGEVLLQRGWIKPEDLRRALEIQSCGQAR